MGRSSAKTSQYEVQSFHARNIFRLCTQGKWQSVITGKLSPSFKKSVILTHGQPYINIAVCFTVSNTIVYLRLHHEFLKTPFVTDNDGHSESNIKSLVSLLTQSKMIIVHQLFSCDSLENTKIKAPYFILNNHKLD